MRWIQLPMHFIPVFMLAILCLPLTAVAQMDSMKGAMKGSMEMQGMDKQQIPADLDTSMSRVSENGLFKGDYVVEGETIQMMAPQMWKVTLVTAGGTLVENATVGVKGMMPGHEHGMAASLKGQSVRAMKKGVYLFEGMAFNMEGWWQVSVDISHEGQSDTLIFDLIIP